MELLENYNDNDKELIKLLLGSNDDNFVAFYHLFVHNHTYEALKPEPIENLQKRFIYSEPCDDECINENFTNMILFIACYHAYINYHCRTTPEFNKNFKKQLNKYLSTAKVSISCTIILLFSLHINQHIIQDEYNRFIADVNADNAKIGNYTTFFNAYNVIRNQANNREIIEHLLAGYYTIGHPLHGVNNDNYRACMKEVFKLMGLADNIIQHVLPSLTQNILPVAAAAAPVVPPPAAVAVAAAAVVPAAGAPPVQQNVAAMIIYIMQILQQHARNELLDTTIVNQHEKIRDSIMSAWWDDYANRCMQNYNKLYTYLCLYAFIYDNPNITYNAENNTYLVNQNQLIPFNNCKLLLNKPNVAYQQFVPLQWNYISGNAVFIINAAIAAAVAGVVVPAAAGALVAANAVPAAALLAAGGFVPSFFNAAGNNIDNQVSLRPYVPITDITYCKTEYIENNDAITVYVSGYEQRLVLTSNQYGLSPSIFIEQICEKVKNISWSCVKLEGKDYLVRDTIDTRRNGFTKLIPQPQKTVDIVLWHLYENVKISLCGANLNTIKDTVLLGDGTELDTITQLRPVNKKFTIYQFIDHNYGFGKSSKEVRVVLYDGTDDRQTTRTLDITPYFTTGEPIKLQILNIKDVNSQIFINAAHTIGKIHIFTNSTEQILKQLTNYKKPKTLSEYIKEHPETSPSDIGQILFERCTGTGWYVVDGYVYKYNKFTGDIIKRNYKDTSTNHRYITAESINDSMCTMDKWNQVTNSSCKFWNEWLASIVSCTKQEFTALRKKYTNDSTINILKIFKDVPENYIMQIHPSMALSILKFFNFKYVQEPHLFIADKVIKRLQTMEEWCALSEQYKSQQIAGLHQFLQQIAKPNEPVKNVADFINENKELIVFISCLRVVAYKRHYQEYAQTNKHVVKNLKVPLGVFEPYITDKGAITVHHFYPKPMSQLLQLGGALRRLLHSYNNILTPITIGIRKQNGGSVHFPNGMSTFLSDNDNIETYNGVLVSVPQKGGSGILLPQRYNVDHNAIKSSNMLQYIWTTFKNLLQENNITLTNADKFEAKLEQYKQLYEDINKTLNSLNKLSKYINMYPKQYDNAVINIDTIEHLVNSLNLATGRLASIEHHGIESILTTINQVIRTPLPLQSGISKQSYPEPTLVNIELPK